MNDADCKAWIEALIADFCGSPANSLENGTDEPAWGTPQVGYARGDDPLFAKLKTDIGPFYWTPEEAFALAFPELSVTLADLAVIVYLLPQTAATRRDQRSATSLPAERWARSRCFGEAFNCSLRLHLSGQLSAAGFPAVAPERLPDFAYRQSERFGLASNWSERHTAWIAGLGTFGLSDGLITRAGKAVRLGSVVARIDLVPSLRSYVGHQDWCLWYANGSCGACMHRCPAGAISSGGHDKPACHSYIRNVTTPYVQQHYGTDTTPCGLCQVKIPCEAGIPGGLAEGSEG